MRLSEARKGQKIRTHSDFWVVSARDKVGTVLFADTVYVAVSVENSKGYEAIYTVAEDIDLVPDASALLQAVIARALLPSDAADRKKIPLASGMLDYFTAALIEVAKVSQAGNDQHNPGEKMHWSRGKSVDHADTLLRHFVERGLPDTDGQRHSAKVAWRALAILQLELEAEGAPLARGARLPEEKK